MGEVGTIVSIQRFSTQDGPGIRSTVFFKRCPLACRWCQNPESISGKPQLQWFSARCLGCGSCAAACSAANISLTTAGVRIRRESCAGCGTCASLCPASALEIAGTPTDVGALTRELLRDREYYEQSGGGVTLSGGEPLAQPAFTSALLAGLRSQGIQTALDTSGYASPGVLAEALPFATMVLYDLKVMDPVRHQELTGQSNELILQNFAAVADAVRRGKPLSLWVRTPLVPGATATRDNLVSIGRFLAETAGGSVERWELCAFNNLCRDKYQRLGIAWEYAQTPLFAREELDELAGHARSSGVDPDIVSVTGAARRREE